MPNPKVRTPHKMYIHNLSIRYDGIIGLDFLKQYDCVLDIPNKLLRTCFRDIPLHLQEDQIIDKQVTGYDDSSSSSDCTNPAAICDSSPSGHISCPSEDSLPASLPASFDNVPISAKSTISSPIKNDDIQQDCENVQITIPSRSISFVNLKCIPFEGQVAVCPRINLSKALRIPDALVCVKSNNFFMTSVANISESDVTISVPPVQLEELQESTVHNVNQANISRDPPNCRIENIVQNLRLDHLNQEENDVIKDICVEYSDIFYLEGDKLSFTNAIKHEIDTGNHKPVFTKSYRYPQVHKEEVKTQIQKMLDQGIIRPSVSPWSSPVWVVPKKMDASGVQKWRIVIDYRKLNELTTGDKYPLPNIADLLDQLGKCKYFSTLDLASGFHQIELSTSDIPKTAFSVENGLYEFTRMPFGLKNAPSTFQRVIDNVMTGLQGEQCLVYMDDVIVYSTSLEDHLERLRNVFDRLRQSNLKIQPDKCEFLRKEVAYLGHLITEDGVKPNPAKIEAIQRFPQPRNPKEIKQFLGLTGYYRRFVKDYSKIIKPLTYLLKKDVEYKFDESCIEAFHKCKKFLTEAPILQYPKFDEEFVLTTDASAFAIGSVLSQGPIGQDLPIAYASRTLNPAETRYSVIERELLSIIWSVKHFRPYLYGRRFQLLTDHKPLVWMFSIKDPGSRLARWRLQLEEYDYRIVYKPGKANANADALSRITINTVTVQDEVKTLSTPQKWQHYIQNIPINYEMINHSNHSIFHDSYNDVIFITHSNDKSEIARKVLHEITDENFDFNEPLEIKHSFTNKSRKFYLIKRESSDFNPGYFRALLSVVNSLPEGKTYYLPANKKISFPKILSKIFKDKNIKFVLCHDTIIRDPPKNERKSIVKMVHLDPRNFHKGISETLRKLQLKYYWPNMRQDVANVIKICETCTKSKINRQNLDYPLVITETPNKPFERINIDCFDFNKSTFLSIMDDFSKFTQVYPIQHKNGQTVKEKLSLFFQHFPIPKRIHTDLGGEFNNNIVKDFCKLYDIRLTFSSSDHPQSNGAVERFHATLGDCLRCFSDEYPDENITDAVPLIINSYNNSKSSSTGYTPQEVIFGHLDFQRNLVTPAENTVSERLKAIQSWSSLFYSKIHDNINQAKEKAKTRFDKHVRNDILPTYKQGQLVYLKIIPKNKQTPRYTGPHKIIRVIGERNVELKLNSRKYVVNIDKIKPYITDDDDFNSSDDEPLSNIRNSIVDQSDNISIVAGPSSAQ